MIRVLHLPGIMDDGGVETVIMNWYRRIDRTKIQFDFLVPRTFKGKYDEEIRALGGNIICIPQIKDGLFKYIRKIKKVINDNGPYDIAHIHGIHSGAVSLIACRLSNIPRIIYHAHGCNNLSLKSLPARKIAESLFRFIINKYSDVKIACSQLAGNFVFGGDQYLVLKNAIDLTIFKPKEKTPLSIYGIPSEAIVIGNVARFVKGKNQDFIVRLISEDMQRGGNIYAILVGDGPYKSDIQQLAETLGCESRIVCPGSQTNTAEWYSSMDVFCLPSDSEGLPLVAVEAQACGIPCVTSCGVPDEADQGCVAYYRLSLTDELDKWFEIIYNLIGKRCLDNNLIVNRMTKNGYNIDTVVDNLESIYCKGTVL